MKEVFEARVRSEQMETRVRFLGAIPDAIPYICRLDVLALTSRHEGQPMVLS